MARITLQEAQAWAEPTKMTLSELDSNLLPHIEEEILDQIAGTYDVSTWLDDATTPKIIRTAISKLYVAWLYRRQYSEDTDAGNPYAQKLEDNANMIIEGVIDGSVTIPTVPNEGGQPSFYPNDASDLLDPRDFPEDTSVGPSKFSINQVF